MSSVPNAYAAVVPGLACFSYTDRKGQSSDRLCVSFQAGSYIRQCKDGSVRYIGWDTDKGAYRSFHPERIAALVQAPDDLLQL